MLINKICLSGPEANEPEDYISFSLGVIFPDDITNRKLHTPKTSPKLTPPVFTEHGDETHSVIYLSSTLGSLPLSLSSPSSETNRRLFSHFLWNASLQLATFIEEGDSSLSGTSKWEVTGERVLELGAGTGLAGIVAALMGAQEVVISDYPAPEVLENLRENVKRNIPEDAWGDVRVEGHKWGNIGGEDQGFERESKERFTRILVADCLWMPEQHDNLLKSIRWFMAENGRAWVIAGFHTGRETMSEFYKEEKLKEAGLEVERIYERDAEGKEREWVVDRGIEDITERKRWLVIGVLKRRVQ